MARFLDGRTSIAILIGCWPIVAQAAGPGEPATLAPHRAVYEITLDKARAGAGMSDLTGRMVYELTGSPCDGYTQTMRFVTRSISQEGEPSVNDLRSTTVEDMSAKTFKFNSSQYRDDQQTEVTAGDAVRPAPDQPIKVEVVKPKKLELTIGADALFPVQHSIKLLDAARAGKSIFSADLYDGSEKGEKVYATTAVIGTRVAPGKAAKTPDVKNSEKLESLAAWPVSLSYFDKKAEKTDGTPSYELAFLFFENGVSQRLFIDYGDFSIRGALKDLTFLDAPACEKKP
jgi:EipB-like